MSERYSIFTTSVELYTCGFTHQATPCFLCLADLTFASEKRCVVKAEQVGQLLLDGL